MALSPLDDRYAKEVSSLDALWSEASLIRHRLLVESEWLIALSLHDGVSEAPRLNGDAMDRLRTHIRQLDEAAIQQVKTIEADIHHDVKACEYYLRTWCQQDPDLRPLSPFIHFACTSEDINNLAYAMIVKKTMTTIIGPSVAALHAQLIAWAHDHADLPMLARTHGQPASPTTLGKEISVFADRLGKKISALNNATYAGKFNGAVGNFHAHLIAYPTIDWQSLSHQLIRSLGLTPTDYTTQIEPQDAVTELYHHLHHVNAILTDFVRDMWGYISVEYFTQAISSNQVGSSTMPHKINPIKFENAEGNLAMANALFELFQARLPCSRWQRDLSNSTVLRNQGLAFGHMLLALSNLQKGLKDLSPNIQVLQADLKDAWALMAEPIQTVLKQHGYEEAYELLRSKTQGKQVDQQLIQDCIRSLPLPKEAKEKLLALSPMNYLGASARLARAIT
jgi:adenylosuccinate lyase